MAKTILMEEQELGFVLDADMGLYVAHLSPAPFLPEVGETYTVVWDGTEYECVALDGSALAEGCVLIGNASVFGLPGNEEPFVFGGQADSRTDFLSLTDTAETIHRISVYQTVAAVPSATVKIKGYSGAELEYQDVPKVYLAAPESTVEAPVLVPFTYGEALEDVEIVPDFSAGDMAVTVPEGYLARSAVVKKPETLAAENIKKDVVVAGVTGDYESVPETEEVTMEADFSAGDMVIQPSEGKYLSKATIPAPATLIPENIAEGVDVAGIIGTLAAGSNVKIASGSGGASTSDTVTETITIEHGLGAVPDLIMIYNGMMGYGAGTSTYVLHRAIGMSKAIRKLLSSYAAAQAAERYVAKSTNSFTMYNNMSTTDITTTSSTTSDAYIHNATETTFQIGNSYAKIFGRSYSWVAIAGIV